MRILDVFNRYLEPGGEEAAVRQIRSVLRTRHDVRALDFASESWTQESGPRRITQPLRMVWNPESARRVRQVVREFRPDLALLHNLFPVGSLAVPLELRRSGVPYFIHIHNFRPYSVNGCCWTGERIAAGGQQRNYWEEIRSGAWQGSRLRTAWYAGVLSISHRLGIWRDARGWVANSEYMRRWFIEAGVPEHRTQTLMCSWEPSAAPEPAREHPPALLFLGRLMKAKGITTLLEAWRTAVTSGAEGELWIAGDGPLAEWVARECAQLPGARYLGHVSGEAKADCLRRCRAVVAPSLWWEPLGLVVFDAYDRGKPVLAAASGGLTDTVRDGRSGWLHEPGHADRLAAHMAEVLRAPLEAQRRGHEGRAWLLQNTAPADWLTSFESFAARIGVGAARRAEKRMSTPEARPAHTTPPSSLQETARTP